MRYGDDGDSTSKILSVRIEILITDGDDDRQTCAFEGKRTRALEPSSVSSE